MRDYKTTMRDLLLITIGLAVLLALTYRVDLFDWFGPKTTWLAPWRATAAP